MPKQYIFFSVDPGEVTFKVEKNNKAYDAIDVAQRIGKDL